MHSSSRRGSGALRPHDPHAHETDLAAPHQRGRRPAENEAASVLGHAIGHAPEVYSPCRGATVGSVGAPSEHPPTLASPPTRAIPPTVGSVGGFLVSERGERGRVQSTPTFAPTSAQRTTRKHAVPWRAFSGNPAWISCCEGGRPDTFTVATRVRIPLGTLANSHDVGFTPTCRPHLGGQEGERGLDRGSLLVGGDRGVCLLYTSPSPRDRTRSRMPSSA